MSVNIQRTLGGGGQHILDYLKRMQAENPAFYYAVQADHEHATGGNIFWADAASRMNYMYFGDTVLFDTVYRTNRYKVPFAAFTGLNHHGLPVLFGCALLLNESESTFTWLFQTWLHAISGRYPVSITIEADQLIQLAVTQILPHTRLRFSCRGIFVETQEKLATIYQSHPTFEIEFIKCINETETVDEFDTAWESLLGRYYVMDNAWLQSLYNARQQWVPVYMRDTFFGTFETSGVLNSFFDGFVNSSTTLQMLVKQYEKAVIHWREKELKADLDTTNSTPVLKTPSPMENQAAKLFTKQIFLKFQDELVETLANPATKIDDSGPVTTFRVAKFGDDHKAHSVNFDSFELKTSCSCQMFEYSGITCRHILAVFRAKNVLTLPPHCILKRWTRDAKSGCELDGITSDSLNDAREASNIRYNNLRQEAIKFIEEGSKSIQIYHVAVDALEEATKRVAAAKNPNSGTIQGTTILNGGSQELHELQATKTAALQSADEKEKKLRELSIELENTNQRCEVYRGNLLAVLRDMEEQKLKLSVKVQNARLSLKD